MTELHLLQKKENPAAWYKEIINTKFGFISGYWRVSVDKLFKAHVSSGVWVFLRDKWKDEPYRTGLLTDFITKHVVIDGKRQLRVQLFCKDSDRQTTHTNIIGTHGEIRWYGDNQIKNLFS